eukprot:gene23593-24640_t
MKDVSTLALAIEADTMPCDESEDTADADHTIRKTLPSRLPGTLLEDVITEMLQKKTEETKVVACDTAPVEDKSRNRPLQITYVSGLAGKMLAVTSTLNQTIGDLKMLLELQHNISHVAQILYSTGQISPLEDGMLLAECDSMVRLSLEWPEWGLLGGMGCCSSKPSAAEQVREEIEERERAMSESNIGEVYINPLRAKSRAGKSKVDGSAAAVVANPAFEPAQRGSGSAAASAPPLAGSAQSAANAESATAGFGGCFNPLGCFNTRVKRRLANLEENYQNAIYEIEQLKLQLAEALSSVDAERDEKAQLKTKLATEIQAKAAEIKQLKTQLAEDARTTAAEIVGVKTKLAEVESAKSAAIAATAAATAEVEQLETQLAGDARTAATEIDGLKTKLSEVESAESVAVAATAAATAEVEQLKTKLAEETRTAATDIDRLKTKLAGVGVDEVEHLKTQCSAQTSINLQLAEDMRAAAIEIKQLKTQLAGVSNEPLPQLPPLQTTFTEPFPGNRQWNDLKDATVMAKGAIFNVRVTNRADGEYSLGDSKNTFEHIWDLIEAQIDPQLKRRKGSAEYQLMYPLVADEDTIGRSPIILDISKF